MRCICALAVAALVFVAVPAAGAATVPVSITKTGYVPSAVTATTADTVQFKNDDTVAHQVAFKPTTGVDLLAEPVHAAGRAERHVHVHAGRDATRSPIPRSPAPPSRGR